jgi:hypothetical protein
MLWHIGSKIESRNKISEKIPVVFTPMGKHPDAAPCHTQYEPGV